MQEHPPCPCCQGHTSLQDPVDICHAGDPTLQYQQLEF